MSSEPLYRVQDCTGRGPWRPGFSLQWIDPDKDDSLCPPMMTDFPNWRSRVDRAQARGLMHFGCCARGIAGLNRWFTPGEIARLRRFGFSLVDASSLTVVCESRSQVIGASLFPLSFLPVVPWEMAA